MEKHSLQIKVQRMVPLSDVENLVKQLQVLYKDVPKFEPRKYDNLVEEVASLVDYSNWTLDWFKDFSKFVVCISPDLKGKVGGDKPSDSSFSVENLIKRVTS